MLGMREYFNTRYGRYLVQQAQHTAVLPRSPSHLTHSSRHVVGLKNQKALTKAVLSFRDLTFDVLTLHNYVPVHNVKLRERARQYSSQNHVFFSQISNARAPPVAPNAAPDAPVFSRDQGLL